MDEITGGCGAYLGGQVSLKGSACSRDTFPQVFKAALPEAAAHRRRPVADSAGRTAGALNVLGPRGPRVSGRPHSANPGTPNGELVLLVTRSPPRGRRGRAGPGATDLRPQGGLRPSGGVGANYRSWSTLVLSAHRGPRGPVHTTTRSLTRIGVRGSRGRSSRARTLQGRLGAMARLSPNGT